MCARDQRAVHDHVTHLNKGCLREASSQAGDGSSAAGCQSQQMSSSRAPGMSCAVVCSCKQRGSRGGTLLSLPEQLLAV